MKLSEITKQPQLIEITIDDEEIVKDFGEPLTFHTWDRQPVEVFFKVTQNANDNPDEMLKVIKELVLDEKGKPILTGNTQLPAKVFVKVIGKITELLGK